LKKNIFGKVICSKPVLGLNKEPLLKGRLSAVDLLVLTSLDQLLLVLLSLFTFYKTSHLNEELNCTEPSPSASIPWLGGQWN
jgi:hypothetical protein